MHPLKEKLIDNFVKNDKISEVIKRLRIALDTESKAGKAIIRFNVNDLELMQQVAILKIIEGNELTAALSSDIITISLFDFQKIDL